jgi:hypothetical protein
LNNRILLKNRPKTGKKNIFVGNLKTITGNALAEIKTTLEKQ